MGGGGYDSGSIWSFRGFSVPTFAGYHRTRPNQRAPRETVPDLGAYGPLHVAIRLIRPGTGNHADDVIRLEHAATNEPDVWLVLTPTVLRVDSTMPAGVYYVEVPAFTRYIRWATGPGTFVGGPVVLIDIVAKE